jgi:hypothetical protein
MGVVGLGAWLVAGGRGGAGASAAAAGAPRHGRLRAHPQQRAAAGRPVALTRVGGAHHQHRLAPELLGQPVVVAVHLQPWELLRARHLWHVGLHVVAVAHHHRIKHLAAGLRLALVPGGGVRLAAAAAAAAAPHGHLPAQGGAAAVVGRLARLAVLLRGFAGRRLGRIRQAAAGRRAHRRDLCVELHHAQQLKVLRKGLQVAVHLRARPAAGRRA